MRKNSVITIALAAILLHSCLVCPAAGADISETSGNAATFSTAATASTATTSSISAAASTAATASTASTDTTSSIAAPPALKFIEQSADDKEWAGIQAIVKRYEEGYIQAVNKGDFKIVESYLAPGTAFYSQQKKLAASLFKQGIRQKLVGYSIEQANIVKGKWRVYVTESIEVSAPGKPKKTNQYAWIYDIDKTSAGVKLSAIAKWTGYDEYVSIASGRVKADGYYVDDFGNYYSYLLTDAVNSLYIGRLKEMSANNELMESQKQLISEMRGLGTAFELTRYQKLDGSFNETDMTGDSFDRFSFRYLSKEKKESTLDLKIRFRLKEIRKGYAGFAQITGMEVESLESITIPDSGRTLESFIPKGWKLIAKAGGDLNKDGLEDLAAVMEEDRAWEMRDYGNAPERVLLILLKQKDGGYRLAVQSGKAILRKDEGGVFGDPFDAISVKNGVLTVSFYGGSNYRWGNAYKFRYQNNGWFLIGATLTNLFTGTGEYTTEDYNLSTGTEIITKGIEGGKSTSRTVNRGKKPLVDLKDFDAATIGNSVF